MKLDSDLLYSVRHWFTNASEYVDIYAVYLLPILNGYEFEEHEVYCCSIKNYDDDMETPLSEEMFFGDLLLGIFFKYRLKNTVDSRVLGELPSSMDKLYVAKRLFEEYWCKSYIENQLSKIQLPIIQEGTILSFLLPKDQRETKEQILISFFKTLLEEKCIDGCDANIKSQRSAIRYYPPDKEFATLEGFIKDLKTHNCYYLPALKIKNNKTGDRGCAVNKPPNNSKKYHNGWKLSCPLVSECFR